MHNELLYAQLPFELFTQSYARSGLNQLCTSVPMGSPSITFFRLPTISMLNT